MQMFEDYEQEAKTLLKKIGLESNGDEELTPSLSLMDSTKPYRIGSSIFEMQSLDEIWPNHFEGLCIDYNLIDQYNEEGDQTY